VRDVERLVAVRPPTAATSPRLASPEPGASSKAAPGGEGPAPLAANAPKTMLIIPVWCSHENGSTTVAPMPTAPTPTDFEQLVTTTVSPWFEQFSWRERSFVPTSTPWYDICPTWGPLPLSPEAVAAQHGYVSSAYDRVVMVLASPAPWLGAAEDVPGRRAIVFGSSLDPAVWAHELGHLDGMVHANSLRCLQGVVPVMYSLSATCTSDEYGDPASTMGDHVPFAGFSAVEADQLRWLPPSVITTVTTSTKVRIASYALPHTAFTSRAVKIPLPSGTYYVERRAAVGWDSGLASSPGLTSGVLVRVEAGAVDSSQFTATWQRHGNLLDATPATPTFADAALPMGQVFVTPEGVRIYAAPSGQLTTVYVDMPVGLVAPSNPQRVKAVVQANGTVQVGWDPPARNPGNLTYEIRTSDPNQAPITTTNLTAALPPLPDGTSAVGVRAYVTGNPGLTSQFAASLPRFTFPLPTTPGGVGGGGHGERDRAPHRDPHPALGALRRRHAEPRPVPGHRGPLRLGAGRGHGRLHRIDGDLHVRGHPRRGAGGERDDGHRGGRLAVRRRLAGARLHRADPDRHGHHRRRRLTPAAGARRAARRRLARQTGRMSRDVHQCPFCELRFVNLAELNFHTPTSRGRTGPGWR
jgi:hypothetical protein